MLLTLVICVACETDPLIYNDSEPLPVIYGIFDKNDTIHYLKVGKSFGAVHNPLETSVLYDSLFFQDAKSEKRKKTR